MLKYWNQWKLTGLLREFNLLVGGNDEKNNRINVSDFAAERNGSASAKQCESDYGQRDENAIATLPIEQFAGIDLEEGMTLYGQGENGETVQVIVKNFNNSEVTIDFNHPLAGKDLLFNVKILSVRDATPDEILNSQVFEEDDVCGCDTGICY